MAIVPWTGEVFGQSGVSANYPFCDPIFQNFNVQQMMTVPGVNAAQTYDAPAPKEIEAADGPAVEADKATADKKKADK